MSEARGEERRDPVEVLAGTSLRVYLYLLRKGDWAGVREVQRAIGFRSPSTAKHHLDRLVDLGLAEKSTMGYRARPPRGLLGMYVSLRGSLVPKTVFLSGFLTGATLAYTLLPGRDPVAAAILAMATITSWLVSASLYRALRPIVGPSGDGDRSSRGRT